MRQVAESWPSEMGVIGSALIDSRCIGLCETAGLREWHFADPAIKTLWIGLNSYWDGTSREIDPVLFADHLKSTGLFEKAGGVSVMTEAARDCPSAVNSRSYARQVIDHYIMRRVGKLGEDVKSAAQAGDREKLELALADIAAVKEQAAEESAILGISRVEIGGRQPGVPSQFILIADATEDAGYPMGQTSVVSAYHKSGKTSFMTQEALHIAASHGGVVYASFADLSPTQIKARMLRQSGWRPDSLEADQIRQEVDTLPIAFWSKRRGALIEDLAGQLRSYCWNGKVVAVFLDYIQRIGTRADHRSEYDRITAVSGICADLAEELGCAIIIGSQLTPGKGPGEATTKGSRSVEEDAGLVIRIGKPDPEAGGIRRFDVPYSRFGAAQIGGCLSFDDKSGGNLTFEQIDPPASYTQ